MSSSTFHDLARAWWAAIDRADFDAAIRLMTPDAIIDWPLSNERMTSPEMWRLVNEHYPGRWAATIRSVIAEHEAVVTVTTISDGSISVEAISFFTIHDGKITHLVEYWPEPYAAPEGRSQWMVPIHATLAD